MNENTRNAFANEVDITEDELVKLIKENPLEVFGEEITWDPGNVVLKGGTRRSVTPGYCWQR